MTVVAGDRIDRYAIDACNTLQLPFDPVRVKDREQAADFERNLGH
jgi:hypothetical protein